MADHLRHGGHLVKENQAIWIKVGLAIEPVLARGPHIRPLLLGRVDSPFLRVIPCRVKKRDKLLVLARTLRSESLSRSSRRKESGCSSLSRRIRAACASRRCELRSPPMGLGAICPSCRSSHATGLRWPPQHRSVWPPDAARRLFSIAATTRSRKSTDRAEGMAILHHKPIRQRATS